jgi:hypothetical protein
MKERVNAHFCLKNRRADQACRRAPVTRLSAIGPCRTFKAPKSRHSTAKAYLLRPWAAAMKSQKPTSRVGSGAMRAYLVS